MHNATNHPFWSYSLTQYSQPECERFCLAAQNNVGLDVNLLLFGVWLAMQNKSLLLSDLPSKISNHRLGIIQPLRTLRSQLKSLSERRNDIKAIRDKIKSLELKAEQIQQWWLYKQSLEWPAEAGKSTDQLLRNNLKMVYRTGKGNESRMEEWIETAINCLYPA